MVHIFASANIIGLWDVLCRKDIFSRKTFWLIDSRTITSDSPAKILERKNIIGMKINRVRNSEGLNIMTIHDLK